MTASDSIEQFLAPDTKTTRDDEEMNQKKFFVAHLFIIFDGVYKVQFLISLFFKIHLSLALFIIFRWVRVK